MRGLHASEHTFRQVFEPGEKEERGEEYDGGADYACHLRASAHVAVDPRPTTRF